MRDSKRNFFMKNNFINKEYEGPYKKSNMKNIQYNLENERNKDTIIKLKEQIIAKDKEISDLKVSGKKKDAEFLKTMKLLQQIVRKEESEKYNEQKRNNKKKRTSLKNDNSDLNNNEEDDISKRKNTDNQRDNTSSMDYLNENEGNNNINEEEKYENEEQNQSRKKEEKVKSKGHKKQLNDLIDNYSLKQKIKQQNKLLIKKEMEIEQLKLEQKTTNIAKLKDNFIKNFNELKMVQKQNEMIMNQNNEIQKQKELLEEDRKDLIFNLEKMNEDFRIFQLNREKELKKIKDQTSTNKRKEFK